MGNPAKFMYGRLEHGGYVTLFVGEGGVVRGEVHSPRGIYTIRNSKGGAKGDREVTIRQIDAARLPVVDHGAARPERIHRSDYSAALSAIDGDDEETEEPPDETVDLLVVYTPAAEAHEGGKAEIEATIAAEVEKTNQAFENSDLGHRTIRLVAMKRVNHTESTDHIRDDLRFLVNKKGAIYDPNGVLDEVYEFRESVGVDLVHFFVNEAKGFCGLAGRYNLFHQKYIENTCARYSSPDACIAQRRKKEWGMGGFGISAIPEGCTIQNVFTHELGHNIGIAHDRYSQR